ncbi:MULTISPECIES: hypothetical protein [Pseudoalteromonas]|uniref:Uncharacterized protein n=1 Tax=Pseudoalteromonas amylolytica TaxID=1859457 RepID=A0A1S1MVU8_9GAMM|nr:MULTISPECIES: hypothetical protein [Pseudoalteromonas]OHU87921.1 hypothetical protein BFC16_10965 [Pseudoalteromonas sp. JW3]OHU91361.1 hypothetical protein BET10_11085 [Pseudoalteromonas amylolytica]
MKKVLLASLLTCGVFSLPSSANNDDGVLKYSYSYVYLKCQSDSCNGAVTRWYPMKVYYKQLGGIPPHNEVRVYWNKNVPADIAAGRDIAHTLGDYCPDGSRMTAKWFIGSNFKPTSAIATDCSGQEHMYSVHEFHF